MNCKYCGAEVRQPVGRRAREYCSNAHKQADYRRRHPVIDLKHELEKARARIAELEQMVHMVQNQRDKSNVTISG